MNIPHATASRIIFRAQLDGALASSLGRPEVAFRYLQDLAARLAESLHPACDNAANLLIAFALLARVSDARALLETFADLVDGMPSPSPSASEGKK